MTRGRRTAVLVVASVTVLAALLSLTVARDAGLAAVFLGSGAIGVAVTVLSGRSGRRRERQRR